MVQAQHEAGPAGWYGLDAAIVVAVVPVVDVADACAELGFPDAPGAGVGGGDGECGGPLPPDGECEVKFAGTVLGILPARPGPARQGGQERAVGGDEFADWGAQAGVAEGGQGVRRQIAQEASQQLGVADGLPFRAAGKLDGLTADFPLHPIKAAGGAEAAGAFERGMEPGKELEREIIAGGQLLIGGGGRPGAGQAGRAVTLALIQQLPVVKLSFGERRFGVGSGHATSKS